MILDNEHLTTETLKQIYQEKGKRWLISALVEGSIGYHTPRHAARLIERALKGESKDHCERCDAVFKDDLLMMISHDIRTLSYLENNNPDRFNRVMKAVGLISQYNEEQQGTFSLLYPTMGL